MQYAQRKLHRSVTEMRRSRTGRPMVSSGCTTRAYGTRLRLRFRVYAFARNYFPRENFHRTDIDRGGGFRVKMFRIAPVVALAVAALALAGSALGAPAKGDAATVSVTAGKPSELKFTVLPSRVAKGVVTFKVTNRGSLSHDFKIGGKQTPLIAKGKSATLKVVFAKTGKYPYLCTVPGHAAAGMRGTLTVR